MADTSKTLQFAAGITERQMYHWYHHGWLVPYERPEGSGSGSPLEWPNKATFKAVIMGNLVRAGISPEVAHRIAEADLERRLPTYPFVYQIAEGITVTINGKSAG